MLVLWLHAQFHLNRGNPNCALSSLIRASFDIIFFLYSTILPPLLGPKFAHSLGGASSSPPSFSFLLR